MNKQKKNAFIKKYTRRYSNLKKTIIDSADRIISDHKKSTEEATMKMVLAARNAKKMFHKTYPSHHSFVLLGGFNDLEKSERKEFKPLLVLREQCRDASYEFKREEIYDSSKPFDPIYTPYGLGVLLGKAKQVLESEFENDLDLIIPWEKEILTFRKSDKKIEITPAFQNRIKAPKNSISIKSPDMYSLNEEFALSKNQTAEVKNAWISVLDISKSGIVKAELEQKPVPLENDTDIKKFLSPKTEAGDFWYPLMYFKKPGEFGIVGNLVVKLLKIEKRTATLVAIPLSKTGFVSNKEAKRILYKKIAQRKFTIVGEHNISQENGNWVFTLSLGRRGTDLDYYLEGAVDMKTGKITSFKPELN